MMSKSIQIGMFTIEWINEDELKVTKDFGDHIADETIVVGGDMESIIEVLFIRNKVERVNQFRCTGCIHEGGDDSPCIDCGPTYKNKQLTIGA